MTIFKKFTFEAAHFLPHVEPGHKCGRMHGHSYQVEIHVTGKVGQRSGMVVDFEQITKAWKPLYEILDHSVLNETLSNPTCENLAKWIFNHMQRTIQTQMYDFTYHLTKVVVHETCTAGCAYEGEIV